MNDVTITARFYREYQPVQYEKAGADLTLVVSSSDPKYASQLLDEAQRAVLASVGKSHEFRSATPGNVNQGGASRPAAPVGEPSTVADVGSAQGGPVPSSTVEPPKEQTEEKKPRGRPRKEQPAVDKVPTQDALEAALADAAGKPEPDAGKIAGVDVEVKVDAKDLPPVTDEELQTACAVAAEKITANKVRTLYKNYNNVSRVAEIEQDYRRPFLKDLADLVAKESAK